MSLDRTGPPLETLTHRLAETPREFLDAPLMGEMGRVVVVALVHDLMARFGAAVSPAMRERFDGTDLAVSPNQMTLAAIVVWLLSDPWFNRQPLLTRELAALFGETLDALALPVHAERYTSDPDRREELSRTALAAFGYRPEGETPQQAEDRLTAVSGAERRRLLQASREAEERARAVREALAAKAAQEIGRQVDARLSDEPTDAQRYPTLTDAGRAMLQRLVERHAAPIYRNRSGNRLLAEDVAALRDFEREVSAASISWSPGAPPGWVTDVVAQAHADVPYYRARGPAPERFEDVPPTGRAELAADVARFVPDSMPVERMINFQTTGTTGHPLLVPSHPVVSARYLAFHKRALRRFGVTLTHGAGQVGVMLLGCQRRCFTYVSVTPTMDESGLAKINLHPDDWRDPADRARYVDAMAPEVIAGDPISFAALLDLPVTARPRALLSVAMMLTEGLRRRLEARFACPVMDIYSMNEVGPIGVYDPAAGGHVLLQPRLYVEIVDAAGRCVPDGERGEICVTGGFNLCLPLVRYRTGDFAALTQVDGEPVLMGLSGRRPVRFRTASGRWLNNIDVSHALKGMAMAQFGLRQDRDGALTLRLSPDGAAHAETAREMLQTLFEGAPVAVTTIEADDKILQYNSALPGGLIE